MMENTENTTQENAEQSQPAWFYTAPAEDNEGVAGSGEVPAWFKVDKYKSVDEQAKAYNELASRFGGFESAPEEYALPEGVELEKLDDGMLDIVKEIGKENNMSQKMFNDLVMKVNEYQSEQYESMREQAIKSLGDNAEERIRNVNDWLNVNAPKEIVDMVAPMATNAEAIQALEFFISKSKGARVADNNTQPTSKITQSEYAEQLMKKDNFGNLKISTDRDYKKKMDEMALQLQ